MKHTAKDLYNKVRQFKSQDFILGHSEDDFEELIAYYKNMLKQLDEKKICSQVIQLIWDISAYMLDEICPNCHYSNLRLTSSIDEKDTVKFCDECLYTSINNNYVEIDDEIIPANKKQVSAYLNSIRTKD
ncbi:hypothetical protein H1Z61_14060 [Bacillus aquiflavi]|uniref:Uncharacterized protein n=1 Tax=Bacillus aquiflavi TaxID=2672567 RepID=A0A6B3W229_9BACI|nr:hypothetical protein [Bacillus aquiflavi]NEY82547.1 hypothetical protein [Bacillus aquiflavi]